MKKIWVHKARSFKDAEEFDREYYMSLSASERLSDMQLLREIYLKIRKRHKKNENRKGLRRVITVIQQK